MAMAVGLIGTALSVAGSVVGAAAQSKMIAEQTKAAKLAENSRQQQMQMDAHQRRRQSVREAILTRAQNLTIGVAQGTQEGTATQSAMEQATAMGQENQQGITASETIGSRIFKANRMYADATQKGQAGMALGAGISSLGGALTGNAGAFERVGTYASSGGGNYGPGIAGGQTRFA